VTSSARRDFGHHKGLELEELRNLIAEFERESVGLFYANSSYRDFLVKNLEKAQREIELFDQCVAWHAVLRKFGWEVFDVSSHVDYDSSTYTGFVGTKDELALVYPQHGALAE